MSRMQRDAPARAPSNDEMVSREGWLGAAACQLACMHLHVGVAAAGEPVRMVMCMCMRVTAEGERARMLTCMGAAVAGELVHMLMYMAAAHPRDGARCIPSRPAR